MPFQKITWMPSNNSIAQTSHFFIAATIVLLNSTYHGPIWFGPILVLGWATAKEFTFDLIVEKDSTISSLNDWLWYTIGAAVTTLLLIIIPPN